MCDNRLCLIDIPGRQNSDTPGSGVDQSIHVQRASLIDQHIPATRLTDPGHDQIASIGEADVPRIGIRGVKASDRVGAVEGLPGCRGRGE